MNSWLGRTWLGCNCCVVYSPRAARDLQVAYDDEDDYDVCDDDDNDGDDSDDDNQTMWPHSVAMIVFAGSPEQNA